MTYFPDRLKGPVLGTSLALLLALAAGACASATTSGTIPASSKGPSATPTLSSAFIASHATVTQVASTVPANGDVNPYGVAVVPRSVGKLVGGDTIVSNFNDKANVQGTGTTIVQVSPRGTVTTFASLTRLPASDPCPGGIGLTTALGILPGGWVVVGSLPTAHGGELPRVDPAGCLIVLNSDGAVAETWTGPDINGPWDLAMDATSSSGATIFLSNVFTRSSSTSSTIAGPCTVVRLAVSLEGASPPRLTRSTVIGSGFPWQANKAALIQGPTGVTLGSNGTLYVVDTLDNTITAIPDALARTGAVVSGHETLTSGGYLSGPLGSTLAPNGDLIVANGNNGNVVEITPKGHQIAETTLVPNGAGDLFGLTVSPGGAALLFVNDGTNALDRAS